MINRTFVPVGQGCFAIEQIDDFYVVFDCGTITKHNANTALDFLLNRIIEMLPSDACIRYIFVSHFDEDHINGLDYLLTKYMVKEVVLPLLSERQKILQLLCMTTALLSELRNECIMFMGLLYMVYVRQNLLLMATFFFAYGLYISFTIRAQINAVYFRSIIGKVLYDVYMS